MWCSPLLWQTMEDSLHVLESWWHLLAKSVMDFFFVGTAHLSMQLPIYQPVIQPLLRGHPFLLLSLAVLVMVQQTSPPLCKWMHQEISQVLTLQLSARIRPQLLSNQIFKLQVRPQLACLCYLTSQYVSVSQEHFFQTFNTKMWCKFILSPPLMCTLILLQIVI